MNPELIPPNIQAPYYPQPIYPQYKIPYYPTPPLHHIPIMNNNLLHSKKMPLN